MSETTERPIEERVPRAFNAALEKFSRNAEVLFHLRQRWQFQRAQLGQLDNVISSWGANPREREHAVPARQKLLDDMEAFFTRWRDMPEDQADAACYAETLPPAPPQPSAAQIFHDRMTYLQKAPPFGRGLVFEVEGNHLIVTPASRLTEDDREFLKRNRKAILEITNEGADRWVVA